MTERFRKLKRLLEELFQLNRPELDFGIYRIMHARSAEISTFLGDDLLPQVREAFDIYRSADRVGLEKELAEMKRAVEKAGMDPAESPKVRELEERLASTAVDLAALEAEVYEHLYRFFRRYYSDGDFLSKRVYKPGVYAIPYEGEEVKLHWANADQYYTKTSEYLRDYAFQLRPGEANPMRVHFRLVDAAEGEHDNVKESEDRVFVLATTSDEDNPVVQEVEGDQGPELEIRFEYRPATMQDWPADKREEERERLKNPKPPKQKDLDALAVEAILGSEDSTLTHWIAELGRPHVLSSGEEAEFTRLEAHLRRYNARNAFDYFIHKDLGGFLRRELDFYIKNEVMHLDDIESESVPRVEQYLSKIKVIRRIAGKIIDFLAQLEDFQKKLWLKKKFVVETSWCVAIACIPDDFHEEIAANDAQREEWVELHAIDELQEEQGDLTRPRYSVPLTPDFLAANPTLVVDTRHFDADFTGRLLEAVGDLDELTDGVLFHGENFQALSLMEARYRESVKCVYIDPPYNTGNDGFAYKDSYQHSSWASSITDRAEVARVLLHASDGCFFSSIDDGEQALLRNVLSQVFGPDNFVANVIWQKKYAPANDATWFSDDHDFVLGFASRKSDWSPGRIPRSEKQDRAYSNPDEDPRGPWKSGDYTSNKSAEERPTLYYGIENPTTGEEVWPKKNAVWRYTPEQHRRNEAENRVWWGSDGTNAVPAYKRFLSEVGDLVPRTIWTYKDVGHNQDGIRQLRSLLPDTSFTSPKPTGLLERVARVGVGQLTLDYFAGSGTTGHAVINLNREDSGRRKFILVEMGPYFDTVLLPRLKKVAFTPEWKDGKPERLATSEEAEASPRLMKVVRLESYEDTLNNLETRRSDAQQELLEDPSPRGPDGFREDYILRYMLDVETKGSLLRLEALADPDAYRLRVKRPGSDETREVAIDLVETFNWLIGLSVDRLEAWRAFRAATERDDEDRLRLVGDLESDPEGEHRLRAVTGTLRDGRRALVIWRRLTGDPETDNLILDEWFTARAFADEEPPFDVVYVNGGNNLEGLRRPAETWRVRLIEEDFQRLMFAESAP